MDKHPISGDDAYAIIEILANLNYTDGNADDLRRQLVGQLVDLLDADAWVWVASTVNPETDELMPVFIDFGGIDRQWFEEWMVKRVQDPERYGDPAALPVACGITPGRTRTWLREELVDDESWYENPHVKLDRIGVCGLDHFVYACYANENASLFSGLGFHRKVERPPFTPREKRLLHLASTEISWLHERKMGAGTQTIDLFKMSKQERNVLLFLLSGESRKEIATRLHLSPHTVDDYVKKLYRRVGVGSRNELFGRFIIGNGNDVPKTADCSQMVGRS